MVSALPIHWKFKNKMVISETAMSDNDFFEFCQANRPLRIERNADKTINVMDPTENESGYLENEVSGELRNWAKTDKTGISFSASTGFTLPTGAVRSADASWLPLEKWLFLPAEDRKKFTHVCPEFIVEIRSESDDLKDLQMKMLEWVDNGVLLGWLIDPRSRTTYIYRADGSIETVRGFDKSLSGENVLNGFVLDLSILILPL
jgi:Uma2 family endonuclease